ncbi:hypothetical protein [Paraburkholderia bannensis]|uniref:hypothetical protein n=1 Tax=Paraburkholderia bannensis TaxID=765414 RepID=UPI002AC36AE9|nr:hypothetical protein [Paraburkholderia bannensis]
MGASLFAGNIKELLIGRKRVFLRVFPNIARSGRRDYADFCITAVDFPQDWAIFGILYCSSQLPVTPECERRSSVRNAAKLAGIGVIHY